MSWELHHRKSDDKYAIWSTMLDVYYTKWMDKKDLRLWYIGYKFTKLQNDAEHFFEYIDKEIEE